MIIMNTKTISVLQIALEGEIKVSYLAEKLGMDSWDIQRHLGNLRSQKYVSSDDSFVKLRNNEKVRLLVQLSTDVDIKKILHESNEIVLSFLIEPITIEDLIEKSGLSRSTVYRALKDFKELRIIKKTFCGIPLSDDIRAVIKLNDDFQSVIEFANFIESERKKLDVLR